MSDWLRDFYGEVDRGNIDGLSAYCTAGVTFQLGNMPLIHGRSEMMEAQRAFLAMIASLSHEFVNVFTDGDTSVLEAIATYVRLDGRTVKVPCTTILRRADELIDSMRVYIDVTPVFAEVDQVDLVDHDGR